MKSYLPLQFIPIENDGFHIQVNAMVNNIPARLVVDTGASHTVFDKTRIAGFLNSGPIQGSGLQAKGLGTDIESHILHLDNINVENQKLIDYHAILVDLSELDQLFAPIFTGGIDGILGGDLLTRMAAIFNYKKQKIKLGGKKYPLQVLMLTKGTFHYMISLNIHGKQANLIVDTGASKTVFNKQSFNKFHPFTEEDLCLNDQPSAGIQADFSEYKCTSIENFSFGQLNIPGYKILLLDLQNINYTYSILNLPPVDGILGSDFLEEYKAIIHYKNKTIRLKK